MSLFQGVREISVPSAPSEGSPPAKPVHELLWSCTDHVSIMQCSRG